MPVFRGIRHRVGLRRLDWSVPEGVSGVIVELGANDALRGIDPDITFKNLDKMLARLKSRGIEVLLAGMRAPSGLGERYVAAYNKMYPSLAKKHDVLLYPFFLDGIALKPDFNLSDGLHPNGKGVGIIVKNILPDVEALIKRIQARGKS